MTRAVLDVGTSRIRAGVLSEDGQWVCQIQCAAPSLRRRGERVEQDALGVAHAVERLLSKLVAYGPTSLAMTCQRGTTVLLDAHGEPVAPLISWQDRRPGGVPDWFEHHAPSVWARVARVMSVAAWLTWRWTGRAAEHPATTSPWGSQTEWVGVDMPVERLASSPLGVGVLYCAGGDKNCELLGASGGAGDVWAVSAGTALSLGTLCAAKAESVAGTFRTPSPRTGWDTVEVGLPVGGSVVQRLAPVWGPMPDPVQLPALDGPICVPYFAGSLLDSQARERFVDLRGNEAPALRWGMVVEGMILELRYASQRLPHRMGAMSAVGGLMSPWFAQGLADAFDAEVVWVRGDFVGLTGAALACGWAPPTLGGLRFTPQAVARWAARLERYSKLVRMNPMEDV